MESAGLEYWVIPVTPFQQNATLLRCARSGRGALVDPGGEVDRLLECAREHDVELERILLTHGHIDHAGGAAELARRTGLAVEGPGSEDEFWLQGLPDQARMFGLERAEVCTPDRWLGEGDSVAVGQERLRVLHTPGHTPGHLVFFHPGRRVAIVGDVLFDGSIGRTDFPKGDYQTLMRSIFDSLLPLGDDVRFLPGPGPSSTLGEQRRTNPFLLEFAQQARGGRGGGR